MKPYYEDSAVTQYCGHALEVLSQLPEECVQMVCTSPPYWGLRKYAGEQDIAWGDNHCEHEWGSETVNTINYKNPNRGPNSCVGQPTREANEVSRDREVVGNFCSLCGSWRGAYGLEPTPEMYVKHTIEILRAIRRVLRKDGVVFWNIGDSYNGSGGCHKEGGKNDAGFQGKLDPLKGKEQSWLIATKSRSRIKPLCERFWNRYKASYLVLSNIGIGLSLAYFWLSQMEQRSF